MLHRAAATKTTCAHSFLRTARRKKTAWRLNVTATYYRSSTVDECVPRLLNCRYSLISISLGVAKNTSTPKRALYQAWRATSFCDVELGTNLL